MHHTCTRHAGQSYGLARNSCSIADGSTHATLAAAPAAAALLATMDGSVKQCAYWGHCKFASKGGPQPDLVACGVRSCDCVLHHLLQGGYEARFPALFSDVGLSKRCLACLHKEATGKAPDPGQTAAEHLYNKIIYLYSKVLLYRYGLQ